ncbi:hypothetical protein [Nocardioides endophyticus]|uniref:hypothetical protein n=1 Tax=Nocardioides endophyticus TaxID=1353775 RepID=UPI0031E6F7D9
MDDVGELVDHGRGRQTHPSTMPSGAQPCGELRQCAEQPRIEGVDRLRLHRVDHQVGDLIEEVIERLVSVGDHQQVLVLLDPNGLGPDAVPSLCEVTDTQLGGHLSSGARQDRRSDTARPQPVGTGHLDPQLAGHQVIDFRMQVTQLSGDPGCPRQEQPRQRDRCIAVVRRQPSKFGEDGVLLLPARVACPLRQLGQRLDHCELRIVGAPACP